MNKIIRIHKNLTFLIVLAFITILTQSGLCCCRNKEKVLI